MLSEQMKLYENQGIYVGHKDRSPNGQAVFMFSGHGSQYVNMLKELMVENEIVRDTFKEADRIYNRLTGDILTSNFITSSSEPETLEKKLVRAEVMQPAIYTANMALYRILKHLGISPDILIGHSLGEFSALVAAGVISFEDGLEIVYHRGKSLNQIPEKQRGGMVSLKLSKHSPELKELLGDLDQLGGVYALSLDNSPSQVVISGDMNVIDKVVKTCNTRKIMNTKLKVTHAFHSPILKPAVDYFKEKLKKFTYQPPVTNIFSTITQSFYSKNKEDYEPAKMADLLSSQLVTPFSFNDIIGYLFHEKDAKWFIEVGPNSILKNLVDTILEDTEYFSMYTNKKELDDTICLKRLLAYLEVNKFMIREVNNEMTTMGIEPKVISKSVDKSAIEAMIKEIIAQKTGYPLDILEIDMDLEADLGIDSVKQGDIFVEVFNRMDYKQNKEAEQNEKVSFSTISDLVEFITAKNEESAEPVLAEAVSALSQVAATAQAEQISVDEVTAFVKQAIVDKTGYPVDVLEDDLEFEADLGIDSVKQGEIFSLLFERFSINRPTEGAPTKKLVNIKDVVQFISEQSGGTSVEPVGHPLKKLDAKIEDYSTENTNGRYITISKLHPYNPQAGRTFKLTNKNVIIVEDSVNGKYTSDLAFKLKQKGCNIVVLTKSDKSSPDYKHVLSDFSSPEGIKQSFQRARSMFTKVHGLINLHQLGRNVDFLKTDFGGWDKEVQESYGVIFYGIRSIYDDLEELGEEGFCVSGTNMGGIFNVEKTDNLNTMGGLVTGFSKAIRREIQNIHCKVVDFNEIDHVELTVDQLIQEIELAENTLQVGYVRGKRKCVIVVPDTVGAGSYAINHHLTEDDVILFSGGGRGIINECMKALVDVYNPTVIITGRTPIPTGDEEWIHMNDSELETYKSKFITEKKAEMPTASVKEILYEFEKIKNSILLYKNMKELIRKNPKIHYMACDCANPADVNRLAQEIESKIGKVTGIVNGAGMPSFGKASKKHELESFTVAKVKVHGFYNLYHAFKDHPLKFFHSIGSISGQFGMDGQVDYVAGADAIVKMTARLIRERQDIRSFVIGWTAWDEVGMAAYPVVKKVQQERGLSYISVKEGTQKFLQEIAYGGDVPEVLVFDNVGLQQNKETLISFLTEDMKKLKSMVDENGYVLDRLTYPFIDKVVQYDETSITVEKSLNIIEDIHLRDHVVNGNHVFAGVSHMELYAEVCSLLINMWEDSQWVILGIENVQFDKFVKYFDTNPLTLKATAEIIERKNDIVKLKARLTSDFCNKNGLVLQKDILHSSCCVYLGRKYDLENIPKIDLQRLLANSEELDLDKYYRITEHLITFGPLFRDMNYARKISESEFIAEVNVIDDSGLFSYLNKVNTMISPITFDNIGRTALLGLCNEHGIVAVPLRIDTAKMYRCPKKNEIVYAHSTLAEITNETVQVKQLVIDAEGKLIIDCLITLHIIGRVEKDYSLAL